MSFNPEVVSIINHLYQKVFFSQGEPATVILPVLENTLPNNNDYRIYMDNNRLPTPTNMTLAGNEVTAHRVGDFAYEGMEQSNAGSFHLLNAAGVFNVGLKEWLGPYGVVDDVKFDVVVTRTVDGFTYDSHTHLTGSSQAQIFLNPGDRFKLQFVQNDNETVFIGRPTEFLITRLSRNPYYTPQFPIIS